MASISSDSKVKTLPSSARTPETAKPSGANPQVVQAEPTTAKLAEGGFDPSSSFFPQSLPGGDLPAAEAPRVPRWGRRVALLAAVAVLAGVVLLYYLQLPGEVGTAVESRGTPAHEAGAAALAQSAQPRVTHTLQGDAATSESQPAARVQSTAPATPSASGAGASLPTPTATQTATPTANPALPRVTHTQPVEPAAPVKPEQPQRAAAVPTDTKAAECSGPQSVLGLCEAPRTNARR
jgi:hypothetical protein